MSSASPPIAAPIVRPMERGDLDGVVQGWQALMRAGHEADPRYVIGPDATDAFRARLRGSVFGAFHPFPPAWVAVAEPRVVGFLHGYAMPGAPVLDHPPTARIFDVWVCPDHRKRGLGRQLVEAFVGRARASGHPWVEVGTLARDARAVAFWRSLGFADWQVILLHDADHCASQTPSPSTSIRQGSSSTALSAKK